MKQNPRSFARFISILFDLVLCHAATISLRSTSQLELPVLKCNGIAKD